MKQLTKTASIVPHTTLQRISAEKEKWEKEPERSSSQAPSDEKENSQPDPPPTPPPPQSEEAGTKDVESSSSSSAPKTAVVSSTLDTLPPSSNSDADVDSDSDEEPIVKKPKRRKLFLSNSNFSDLNDDGDGDTDDDSKLPARSFLPQEDIDTSQSSTSRTPPPAPPPAPPPLLAPAVADDAFRIDLSQQADDSSDSSSSDDGETYNNYSSNNDAIHVPATQFDALPDDDYCDSERTEENELTTLGPSKNYRNPGALVTAATTRRSRTPTNNNRSLLNAVAKKSSGRKPQGEKDQGRSWNGFKGSLSSFVNDRVQERGDDVRKNVRQDVVDLCESSESR